METYGADVIKLNEISYNTNYRLVTNEMNLKFDLDFDDYGIYTKIISNSIWNNFFVYICNWIFYAYIDIFY